MGLTLGRHFDENKPLELDIAFRIVDDNTLIAPLVWMECKGWRDVKPGEFAPSGVCPSMWIGTKELDDRLYEGLEDEYGVTWLMFIRKPTDKEAAEIKWKE